MKLCIALGTDHGGFELKNKISAWLREGYEILDMGAHELDPADDYPDFAFAVARAVALGEAQRGIIICGSGVGACIAANKIPGVRAGLCHDTYSAKQGVELARELITVFLKAHFTGEERHCRRLKKILTVEQQTLHKSIESSQG